MSDPVDIMKTLRLFVIILAAIVNGSLSADLCALRNTSLIRIPENVTVGTVIGRFDVIGGDNEVVLKGLPNAFFNVNSTSREITLAAALDFEAKDSFRLNVICSQQNPTLQINLVRIVVLTDINDNSPVFSSGHYYVNVSELAQVDSIIYSGISATDGDKTNLYMQYDVVLGPFSSYLDFERASKGEVTLKISLDYETLQSFTVEILALDTPQDTNSPRRSAVVNLTVMVQNEDDMDPAFSRDHYKAQIASSTEKGTVIITEHAIFAEDQDLRPKSPLLYSLWEYGNAFTIDPQTAEVRLQKPLQGGTYTAILRVAQIDNRARRAISTLTVVVSGSTGTPNRAPRFLKTTYDVMVFENTPVNQVIISVPAVDPDFGSSLRYQLKDNQNGMFSISSNADIQLLKPLDYEKTPQYSLDVTVTDNTFASSATVNITVGDVNDNNPEVVDPSSFVKAKRERNSFITKVEASDEDKFSRLSFSLVGTDGLFTVNDEGEVFMVEDAEKYPRTDYSLVVIVQDNGVPPRQATAHVLVRLPEINVTEAPATSTALKEAPSEALPIVLGIIAAVLLFVVIVLAILLIRRKKRQEPSYPQIETPSETRRASQDGNLEKVKPPSHLDPEGLAYRSTAKPNTGMFPSTLDLNLDPDHGETEDGATTIQDNPISSINHGYSGSDVSEAGRDMDDIRIQTSMTPYGNGYPGYVDNDMYGAGDLKTFHNSASSNESLSSDSTPGSKKQLVKPDLVEHSKNGNRPYSWNNLNGSTTANSNGDIASDGRRSADEKPEITVYF